MQSRKAFVTFSAMCLLFALSGCGQTNTAPVESSSTSQGDEVASTGDLPKGLSELSSEDYALALKQKICPVSGEDLGSMGAPEKVNVNGKAVWICCDGCRERLLAEPDKYLAALAEQGVTPPDFE